MTRREYVLDVWLPEHGTWLTLACAVLGAVTAPDVPGAGAQALAWLGAAAFWAGFLTLLRAVTWRPWREEAAAEPRPENVVPMRPGPPRGLHRAPTPDRRSQFNLDRQGYSQSEYPVGRPVQRTPLPQAPAHSVQVPCARIARIAISPSRRGGSPEALERLDGEPDPESDGPDDPG